jgi:hypothetical protein
MGHATKLLKSVLPTPMTDWLTDFRRRRLTAHFAPKSPKEAFSEIYSRRLWGAPTDPSHRFCSGSGSSDPAVVTTYVKAVSEWMASMDGPPSVGDLGCGDFQVGSQLVAHSSSWTAYDCVSELLAANCRRWGHLPVTFAQLDLCAAKPIYADVFFVRQVLQHLSNTQIQMALRNLLDRCRWLVVTEHIPTGAFVPNRDKPIGPDTRLSQHSGVVLTADPFRLRPLAAVPLCRVEQGTGLIDTVTYRVQ